MGGLEDAWNTITSGKANPYYWLAKEATTPIWDRQTTKTILGESGADKLQDVFNPARWVENTVNENVPEPLQDATKKAIPIVAIGGAALLALLILKAKF